MKLKTNKITDPTDSPKFLVEGSNKFIVLKSKNQVSTSREILHWF